MFLLLFTMGVLAGAQNALAGGGSFLLLPTLMLAGMDARAANITGTVALWPGQISTGVAGRHLARGMGGLGLTTLSLISLCGGGVGAVLLLITPGAVFAKLVPFLVLAATVIFAWGSFIRRPVQPGDTGATVGVGRMVAVQFGIATYGGYFGGGIGILMLAAFTLAGLAVREAGATKNVLNAVLNTTAVAIFATSPQVHWAEASVVSIGAILGGQIGTRLLSRINDRPLKIGIVAVGLALSAGLCWRALS